MPTIDLSYLERLYNGDRKRVSTWVEIFLEEIPLRMEEMAQCVQRSDAAGLSALAHELKPQAHYLGAQRMLEVLQRIGGRTQCDGTPACHEEAGDLNDACAEVVAELRATFNL